METLSTYDILNIEANAKKVGDEWVETMCKRARLGDKKALRIVADFMNEAYEIWESEG